MRYVSSIHAPNIGYLTTPEELLRLARSGLVGLDIWFLSTVNFDGIESTVYQWLRRRLGPDALLGVRMYTEHWPDKPAANWADECADHLALIPGLLDDPNVVVSPFNEADLENEGLPWSDPSGPTIGDYRFIWRYQYAKDEHGNETGWLPRMKQRLPNAKIRYGTAPLAGGHNPVGYPPDWEYAMPEAKACIDVYDVHWLHQYIPREATADGYGWQEGKDGYWHGLRLLRPAGYQQDVQGFPPVGGRRDPGGALVQYPGKLAIISEWGNWHHDDAAHNGLTLAQFRYCYERYTQTGRVLMICPFIYNSGPEHGGNVMGGNIDLMHGLQAIDYPAADWPHKEDEMAIDEAKIQQLLDQNHLLTEALKAIRQNKWTGADGVDGFIVALQGGAPLGFTPSFPKA